MARLLTTPEAPVTMPSGMIPFLATELACINNAIGTNTLGSNPPVTAIMPSRHGALIMNTGANNTAIGEAAGADLTQVTAMYCIGADVFGVSGESNTTRIRNIGSTSQNTGVMVTLDVVGGTKLGYFVVASSRRYKNEIKPMGDASKALYLPQSRQFPLQTRDRSGPGTAFWTDR